MVNREPEIPNMDLTDLFIRLRNLLNHLPRKGTVVRLSTREDEYVGRIQAVNVAERRVSLVVEDGTNVIIPFQALMLSAEASKTE